MEPCCGSSVTRTAKTLLMFPLGRVILVHTMPKGSGLVWGKGLEIYLGEAEGELWLKVCRRNKHSNLLELLVNELDCMESVPPDIQSMTADSSVSIIAELNESNNTK